VEGIQEFLVLLQASSDAKNLGSVTHRKSAADRDYSCRVVISGAVAGLADMLVCIDWPAGRPLPLTVFEDGKTNWANRRLDQVCLVRIRNMLMDPAVSALLGLVRELCIHKGLNRFFALENAEVCRAVLHLLWPKLSLDCRERTLRRGFRLRRGYAPA
jgi:hypothetical protein